LRHGITLQIGAADSKRPVWMKVSYYEKFLDWYFDYTILYGECPDISEAIDAYMEIVVDIIRSEIESDTASSEINDIVARVSHVYDESRLAEHVAMEAGDIGIEVAEALISDLYIRSGLSFRMNESCAGFIFESDMAVYGAEYECMVLGPFLPILRVLEYQQGGFSTEVRSYHSMFDHINSVKK